MEVTLMQGLIDRARYQLSGGGHLHSGVHYRGPTHQHQWSSRKTQEAYWTQGQSLAGSVRGLESLENL